MSLKIKNRTSRDEFIAQNRKFIADRADQGLKTLITYVKDEWGYKKGVVVALSPTQIGWSLVHQDKDSFYQRVNPQALPVVQKLNREIALLMETGDPEFLEDIVIRQDQLVAKLTKLATGSGDLRPGVVKGYKWDREKGLHGAFRHATKGDNHDAVDEDVIFTLVRVSERAIKFFAPKEANPS